MKWEYWVTSADDMSLAWELNDAGKEGWEVVAINSRYSNTLSKFIHLCVFKRPLIESDKAPITLADSSPKEIR
jgi:hypothetical protein